MSKKDARLVYTSDPVEAKRLREAGEIPKVKDLPFEQQTIRVEIDRKQRKGKTVTVASGFHLTKQSLDRIAKRLKARCAAGGRQGKDDIEIQGEHVGTIADELTAIGFKVRKISR